MATIGSILIGMSAEHEKLEKDLKKGASSVTAFASKVTSQLSGITNNFGGVGAVLSASAFTAWVMSAGDAIDKAGDLADTLGTTTARLSELRYIAQLTGSSTEALDTGLSKLSINLGKAAAEGGPAADSLKGIGLDAKKLAQLDIADAFKMIASRVGEIENPAKKSALAVSLFGKGGLGLLNTLNASSSTIAKLSGEFNEFGAITEGQRAKVGDLFDAMDRFGAIVQGTAGKIAVFLAPALTGIVDIGSSVIKKIAGIGFAFDAFVQKITAGRVKLGAPDASVAAPKKVNEEAASAAAEAAEKSQAFIDKLKDQQATYGMTSAAAEIYRLKQTGATAEVIKQAEALSAQIDKLDEAKKAQEKYASAAESIISSTRSPLESFKEQIAQIRELERVGALTQEQAGAAAGKAQTSFFGGAANKRASALELGSSEARSAILDFRGQSQNKPMADTARSTEQTAKATAAANGLLIKLINEVSKLRSAPAPDDLLADL